MASEKCLVKDCQNHAHQGNGIYLYQSLGRKTKISILGWICAPCLDMVMKGEGRFSQVYRNAIAEFDQRNAILAALQKDIALWEGIVAGKRVDSGASSSALCQLSTFGKTIDCTKIPCPIYEETGVKGCETSPYTEWASHQVMVHGRGEHFTATCDVCKTIATKMLNFLKEIRV